MALLLVVLWCLLVHNFLHHQDFEDAKISLSDLENKMREKEILYDHKLDKKNQNKWITKTKLVKI